MTRSDALAVGGALSFALHVALYSLFVANPPRPVGLSAQPQSRGTVQVRMLPLPAAAALVQESSAQAAPPPVADLPPLPEVAPGRQLAVSAPAASGPSASSPAGPPTREAGQATYFPRSMLTLGPSPLGVVVIPYPRFIGDQGWYAVQVSLYIDESGVVRRVEFDDQDLPETLQAGVREAFLGTAFVPGQIDGQAVKSRVRIEITFGSRPTR